MSSRDYSIKGKKKGERVAISDCNIEPLNLLIPGGAPILVPKHKAWPGQKKKARLTVKIPLGNEDFYDAEEDEDELGERPAAEVKCRKVIQAAKANSEKKTKKEKKKKTASCKVGNKKGPKADTEGRDRKKLMQRIKGQEAYVAQLKAEYEGKKTGLKAHDEVEGDTYTDCPVTTTDGATQTSEDKTSDEEPTEASEKVRRMLKAIRIRAAGTGGEGFTPSEDAQILARKAAGESFKTIAGYMKRPKKQISQRHGELVKAGKTAETAGTDGPGEGATTDAATAGETTDGAEKTTDADDDAQVAEGDFGGLFDLGGLTTALEGVAAEQAEAEKKDSPAKKSDDANRKAKNQQHKPSPAGTRNAEAEITGGESDSEAVPDGSGTRLYINQYARYLLRNQNMIPEADDKFDEEDCILLALTESQLEHGRWDQIQAGFANLTGRMVPVEVLKYKLGGGDKPEYY
ncbi:hypothetical protein VSDG_01670 [Cytospora chrysosperma]|uniref:Myb-like domain-containing protein n=1 Tax=Cytospora chrysosperma TaxID=252740 RepID=A0A423WHH3_CYTCH|nr:hypothetical protein VSDG_01670 [Valsa sordida]